MRHYVALALLSLVGRPATAQDAGDAYTLEHFPMPPGARLEVGGMDFLDDGSLVLSTRRGEVWILENPLVDDVADARWRRFASGLWEGLGLNVVDGQVYVIQRGELSRLRDVDGDGECDHVDTIADGWGLSGNYHEFAFGLPTDADGNFYVGLNLAFFSPKWWHGKSAVPYRGWVLRVSPEGEITPWAYGFRSPCGLGTNAAGDIFVTDNQGDWTASSPIYHLERDAFYSHPASLNWTEEYLATATQPSDTVPPPAASRRKPPAIWIPYDWSRSTGNLVTDTTGGRFGPFEGQLFVAELTEGRVLRADMERVRGEYQGWIAPFKQAVGSACRVAFASDGTLFCGLTNRGWGGRAPNDGLARVRWTGRTPMEIASVHLAGSADAARFEVGFTHPVADGVTVDPSAVKLTQYDYSYWWEYGSPETNRATIEVERAELSADRRTLVLSGAPLRAAMVARVELPELESENGEVLAQREFAYTINQFPDGPPTTEIVAKVVAPPPPKESAYDGWLMLSWGDATDAWHADGWELCEAEIDRDDPRRFATSSGNGALVNTGEGAGHFVSKWSFGDVELSVDFMLPEHGNSGVYLMGRYEVQLLDSTGVREPGPGDCGGIYESASWPGSPPTFNAFREPGRWHELDLAFRAPRFDAEGRKIASARFDRVSIDGTVIQRGIVVPEPTIAAMFSDEAATGPVMLQGDHGPVAFRDVRVKPLGPGAGDEEGWENVFPEEEFDDWIATGDAEWELDGEAIVGSGARGHLFSKRSDYENFELRARVKISDGGNSGLYFRTQPGEGGAWPTGYEAQVNSSFPDAQKTGSLYGLAEVRTHLVPPENWFDYAVTCRDEAAGTRVTISINGIRVTDFLDTERGHATGHVALQQHHQGSTVHFADVRIRELE